MTTEDFETAFRRLRTAYKGRLEECIQTFEKVMSLSEGLDRSQVETVFMLAHKLAGSAATLGFENVSTVAYEAEREFAPLMNLPDEKVILSATARKSLSDIHQACRSALSENTKEVSS
jgi:HPt (histidine-containing phosphotransfer) domain-containing protein